MKRAGPKHQAGSRYPSGRVTLERAISKLGLGSRAEARAWIEAGQVKVHGSVETNPARPVNPEQAHIEIQGKKAIKEKRRILLFHKPKGVVTTKRDPEGRPTIYDFLPPELQNFHAVGRLDMHTTGLLLLTNDSKFSSALTDPVNAIARTYVVKVRGEVGPEALSKMKQGIEDEGEWLRADSVEIQKSSGRESTLILQLSEGKNREIRRLCLSLGHEVIGLKRIRFGEYSLGSIAVGNFEEVE